MDTYYGFSATSVEQRQGPPDKEKGTYLQADVFEGQMICFMKIRDNAYADAISSNRAEDKIETFYDFEFKVSIRDTNAIYTAGSRLPAKTRA